MGSSLINIFSCVFELFVAIFSPFATDLFAQQTGALDQPIITEKPQSEKDFKGVIRAISDLQNDINSVTDSSNFEKTNFNMAEILVINYCNSINYIIL